MSGESSPSVEDSSEEIIALVRKIHEAQQRLRELTDGEVDAVIHPDGHSYLLHEAQEKLRLSETAQRQLAETMQAILNALPAHIALLDPRGVIISVNDIWKQFATANELQGPSFAVEQNYLEICDRATGDCSEEAHKAAAGIRSILSGAVEKFSLEYPCHSHTEKRWFELIVTPVSDLGPAGAVVMHIDITARKLNDEALRASNESLAASQHIANLGSWEMDLVHLDDLRANPLRWSDEMYRILGYLPQSVELTPDFYLKHIPTKERSAVIPRLERLICDRQQQSHYYSIKRSDGEERIVHTVTQVLLDEKTGHPLKLYGTVHDITDSKRAEEQLVWKSALLEAQLNSTLDGILVVDNEGKKILQNKRMADLWNLPAEIVGDPDVRSQRAWVASLIKNPRAFTDKIAYLDAHPDEISSDEIESTSERFFDRYSAPLRGQDGKHYGRIWSYREITERKFSERKVAEQVELINIASRVGKLGAWAIEFPGPKIIWSDEVYRIHGVDTTFKPDLETALDFFPPESRKKLAAAIQSGEAYDLELDFVTANGEKRWVRTTSEFERKDGENYRFYGIFQDLTDRKLTETRFRRLVDSNVQGVLFWNTKGEITGANDAFLQLVGYSREELKAGAINWMAMTPPEYAHLDRRALEEIAATGRCPSYEKEFICKDGSRVPVLLGAAIFEDNPEEGVCFMLDLTERKKLEQQFLRAQRMESIGTLAGGIAHDLNNILAPIMMSIDILKTVSDHPQAKSILDTIEVSAKRGADIVRQVLSFARGLEGERIEVQPKHLLADLENIIRDTFPKDIQMQFSVPEETWTILGDPTQVHQILLNLCVNARDAMPHGGKLTVSVENCVLDEQYAVMNTQAKAGRYVNISVTDSGTGMPPGIIDKIFEPFFTTKELNKGTGLGLSTVMAVVKSHAGVVNVYSELGRGTTFKVYLPAMETSTEVRKKQTQQLSLARGKGETILVIDDEASILTITSQTLQAFGYRVLTATDGAEALAIYAEHKSEIAAVLTDMMMPVMDGMAVIRVLTRINPAVKIIAASGLNANSDVTAVSGGAVKHFLTKPYTAGTLLRAIRAILDETKL